MRSVAEQSKTDLVQHEQIIKEALDSGFPRLRFPGILEAIYFESDLPVRLQRYLFLGWASLFIYDLFAIGDYLMLSDVYHLAWAIRLCVVSPLILGAIFLSYKKIFIPIIDYLIDFIIFIAAACIILMLFFSDHENSIHYYTGIFIIVIFGNIVMRLRFWHALSVSLLIQLLFTLTLDKVIPITSHSAFNVSLVLMTTIVISLIANYRMEKELRRVFLLNLLLQIDSIKLEESNKVFKMLSISDPLTGLSNRRYFDATLEREVKSALRKNHNLCLLFLDIDYFKLYNDTYGHQAGDVCIRKIADSLQQSLKRPRDMCARYGGEEFVVLLPDTDIQGATGMAETIRMTIEDMHLPHKASQISDYVTVSLGVSELLSGNADAINQLIENADKALYCAKNEGRNRVRRYSQNESQCPV
ncbi:MAG TPA: GGDEF domain-containing protein [Spirochaetota bacterium]|nr:GGDEF domain-containing protein [Spirochaetota bacterium]HPI90519.1 GGDEF domain-containing protein [Spirochaetota bacterium]HPR47881.1 GGDEF domain-containing protein [Spirochaetota bacterium]